MGTASRPRPAYLSELVNLSPLTLSIVPVFTPWRIRAPHPAPIKENVRVLAIKKGIGEFGFVPIARAACFAVNNRHPVAYYSPSVSQVHPGKMLLTHLHLHIA